MPTKEQVTEFILEHLAEALKIDKSQLTMDTDIIADFHATSLNIFPFVNVMEDEYDIEIQYSDFRVNCKKLGMLIDYLYDLI